VLLKQAGLPRRIPSDILPSKIYELMYQDKKVLQNKLRFILIRAPGDCYVDAGVCEQDVQRALADAVSFT
jgi:3-dehydroquinate synthase